MAAQTSQIDELHNAATWLEQRQLEVMPAFRLQRVTVHIVNDPVNAPGGDYAEVQFTWQGDHYDFTVTP